MDTLNELIETAEAVNEPYDKTDENIARAAELESLGFKALADEIIEKVRFKEKLDRITKAGYSKITVEKIQAFLRKKVELYDAKKPKRMLDDGASNVEDSGLQGLQRFLLGNTFSAARFAQSTIQASDELARYFWIQLNSQMDRVTAPSGKTDTFTKNTVDRMSSEEGTVGFFQWTETPLKDYKTLPPSHVLEILKTHKDRRLFDYFTIAQVNEVHDPLLLGRIEGDDSRYFIAQWGDDIALEDVL